MLRRWTRNIFGLNRLDIQKVHDIYISRGAPFCAVLIAIWCHVSLLLWFVVSLPFVFSDLCEISKKFIFNPLSVFRKLKCPVPYFFRTVNDPWSFKTETTYPRVTRLLLLKNANLQFFAIQNFNSCT